MGCTKHKLLTVWPFGEKVPQPLNYTDVRKFPEASTRGREKKGGSRDGEGCLTCVLSSNGSSKMRYWGTDKIHKDNGWYYSRLMKTWILRFRKFSFLEPKTKLPQVDTLYWNCRSSKMKRPLKRPEWEVRLPIRYRLDWHLTFHWRWWHPEGSTQCWWKRKAC